MVTGGDSERATARERDSGAPPRAARASGAAAGERAPRWSRRTCCTGSGRPGRSYPRPAGLRSGGQRGGRRWQSAEYAGCRCCQAHAAPPAPQERRARAARGPGARGAAHQGARASGPPSPSLATLWTHRLCECDLVAPEQTVQGDEECGLACAEADSRGAGWLGGERRQQPHFPASPPLSLKLVPTGPLDRWVMTASHAGARLPLTKPPCGAPPEVLSKQRHQEQCRGTPKSLQHAVCGEGDGEGGPVRCPPAPPWLCTPPSPRTALQRVRRSAPERRRDSTGLRRAGWLGSGSPDACAQHHTIRPPRPAPHRLRARTCQDQGHRHRAREADL